MKWTDNSDFELGFKIERASGLGFIEIAIVSANINDYTDTDLSFSQSYVYRVAAYSTVNTSNWVTTTAATEFPSPSDLVASSMSDTELELSWTDNTNFEVGFKIERDSGTGFVEMGTVSSDVTNYTDSGLSYGQNYEYRISAYTLLNTSSWVTITTATEFPAPTNLTATSISDSEIELTWTDNTNFESGLVTKELVPGFVDPLVQLPKGSSSS